MTNGSTIDVAVVAYRHWELTRSCLEHLARQTITHRVILCDNGCDEDTADHAAAEFPDVSVVRLARNQPYPVACNRAVAAGTGDLVVMMNNDVDARADFLQRLVAPFADAANVGSVTSVLLAPGESVIDSVGLVADTTLSGFPRHHGQPAAAAGEPEPILTGPAGAAAAFRRRAWAQVGGLDERIPAYMEDLDLALRLQQAGWTAGLALDAIAVHIGGATYGRRSTGQRWRAGYSRGYLVRRYGILRRRSGLRTLLTEAIVCTGDLLISRDLCASFGRIAGWRAARGLARHPSPPGRALDSRIGLADSLRRRRGSYARPASG